MVTALLHVLAQAEEPASGMPWWAYLIWAWFLVSLSVYAYRLYRRFIGKHEAADRREQRTSVPPPTPAGPSPTEALFLEAKAAQQAAAAGGTGPGPDGSADDGGASAGGSDRRGLFASSDAPSAPSRPVPELLEGIAMPCDLVPVTDEAVVDPSFHRVAFHTHTATPAEVGRALGDALERLGFTLRSTSDTEVVARRGDDELHVVLHPRADAARRDDGPAYPSIPPGDVVVELTS